MLGSKKTPCEDKRQFPALRLRSLEKHFHERSADLQFRGPFVEMFLQENAEICGLSFGSRAACHFSNLDYRRSAEADHKTGACPWKSPVMRFLAR